MLIPITVGVAILAVVVVAAWWLRSSLLSAMNARRDDVSLTLLQNQLNATSSQMTQQLDQLRTAFQQISGQVSQSMDTTRKTMDERLDNAARVIQGVSRQLGQLDESTKRIFDVGRDISSLQEVLRSPKLRGNISELFLEDLLAQILPPRHFRTQYAFRNGQIVDAVIMLKAGMAPVDAKFPLENFRLIISAASDDDKKKARKSFLRDVKAHVDAIAEKYIRPDEGTFDFALMYIPAENVYYETIIKDDEFGGEATLFNYALNHRVIPVSPNSFYAYLQTILLGLKGMRVEESAREMMNSLAALRKEFERFGENFRLIGQHLDKSLKKYAEADKQMDKLQDRMMQIDGTARMLDEPGQPVSALTDQ